MLMLMSETGGDLEMMGIESSDIQIREIMMNMPMECTTPSLKGFSDVDSLKRNTYTLRGKIPSGVMFNPH